MPDTSAESARIRPFDRQRQLAVLASQRFDVLVIGGGITGCGVVLDAASRGLRAALVERDDFASGTSSRLSKLVHGGLRYLQSGDVRLMREGQRERLRLLRNAPHLVQVLPFLLPMLHDGPPVSDRAIGAGMWAYDLAGAARIGRHRRLSGAEAIGHMPT